MNVNVVGGGGGGRNEFLPGEHLRGGRGPDLNIRNSYDGAGTLTSVLPREGIDIGPRPDFWGDMDEMLRRMPTQAAPAAGGARRQSAAVRTAPPSERSSVSRGGASGGGRQRTPIFRKVISGFNMSPGYMEVDQGDPGATFSGWRL